MSDVSAPSVAALCACGITASSDVPRCRACPALGAVAATPAPAPAAAGPGFGTRAGAPLPPTPPPAKHSRWAKSTTSFGPVGRVVATVLVLVPLVVFGMTFVSGVGMVGAGLYLFLVVPRAMRDIWKKARVAPPA